MPIIKSVKKNPGGTELPNQERIKMLGEKENHKYLGRLEVDTIKRAEIKENTTKQYFRRT